ncbi:MAG: ABC transporter substrate-binding protein [Variovorax sp.]
MINRRNFTQSVPAGIAGLLLAQWGLDAHAAVEQVRIAYPIDVPSWDPSRSAAPNPTALFKCVFDQPLEYTPDSKLQPGVVTAYQWLDKDGLVLQLDFRDDVYFHNGDKLTSADFKFTFFDRLRAEKGLQLSFIWGDITAIETPSPTRAVIRFGKPMVTAPQFLGYSAAFILPKAYYEKVGLEGFLAKPVGSGPYRLVDYQRDSSVTLEAFDRYWRGPAKIRKIVFQVVKDPTTRVSAVQSGQVQLAAALPMREALRLGQSPGLANSLTPTVDTYLVQMVNSGPLADRNVRLAMHHAIDKRALSKAFFNSIAAPLSTAAAPGTPAYAPDYAFAFDPARSQALLKESGYGPGKAVQFRFFATNGIYPNDFEMARALVQMWKKVGIDAALEVIEPAQYYTKVQAGKLEGPTLWFWTNATGDPELSAGYYLDPKKSFSVWRSPDVSTQLDPLLVELNLEKRIEGYKKFHVWAVEQGYSLPLVQGVSTVVYAKAEAGYKPFKNGWILPYYWSA